MKTDEYQHLWDGTEPGWALIRDAPGGEPRDIYNTQTKMMLIIEDDAVASEVRSRMLASGVEILDDIAY